MTNARLIRAFLIYWNLNSTLSQIPIRSTRVPVGTQPPYALISSNLAANEFNSSGGQIADYEVTISIYVGQDKQVADEVAAAMNTAFQFRIFSIVGAKVLSCIPDMDVLEVDKDTDALGRDVNVVQKKWLVKLFIEY